MWTRKEEDSSKRTSVSGNVLYDDWKSFCTHAMTSAWLPCWTKRRVATAMLERKGRYAGRVVVADDCFE
jgi:hypothetical protein